MIVFDSDVSIEILRSRPNAIAWFASLSEDETVAIPGYVAMELARGCENRAELRDLQRWIARFRVLWLPVNLCQAALSEYFDVCLRNAIDSLDMLIAHTALHHGVPLYTFNQKHYKAVKGLRTIQPFRR